MITPLLPLASLLAACIAFVAPPAVPPAPAASPKSEAPVAPDAPARAPADATQIRVIRMSVPARLLQNGTQFGGSNELSKLLRDIELSVRAELDQSATAASEEELALLRKSLTDCVLIPLSTIDELQVHGPEPAVRVLADALRVRIDKWDAERQQREQQASLDQDKQEAEARAQEQRNALEQAMQRDRARQIARDQYLATVVTLDWKGGTLGELIDAIRTRPLASGTPAPLNLILGDPEVAACIIPPFKVTEASPEVLLKAVAAVPQPNGVQLLVTQESGASSGVTVLSLDKPATASAREFTEVYDLARWLEDRPGEIKSLLDAVSVALEMQGATKQVQLRFHESTGLLFVRATADAQGVIQRTIELFKDKRK